MGAVASAFHETTKHTPQSVRADVRRLDPSTMPVPFKRYEGAERIDLAPAGRSDVGTLDAIAAIGSTGDTPPDLGRLLGLAAGVTRRRDFPGGRVHWFRTWASAGALYPIEVYVAKADGVWHYDPLGHALERVGDARADTSLVLTGIPWRTAWKYRARGYRHLFWDAGMILANALAVSGGGRVLSGFVDDDLAAMVGVDGVREFPLCVLAFGDPPAAGGALREPDPPARGEVAYETARLAHRAGALTTADDVRAWQRDRAAAPIGGGGPSRPLDATIRRRGSARRFTTDEMARADLEAVLRAAARDIPSDAGGFLTVHVIAHAVDGLASGAYLWRDDVLVPVREGAFRDESRDLCLEQPLGGDGAATCFLMADLERALATLGDRGYRVAQLEAGVAAGLAYLAAYSLGHSATGLTFYDDEVSAFFGTPLACMLVCALGTSPDRPIPLAPGR